MEVTQGAPFESFGLSEATMRAIRNKHYTVSTPVQAGCIPPMLAGKDVIAKWLPPARAKTMAFGIPIIERIDRESEEVQAVILAPTRELAMPDHRRDAGTSPCATRAFGWYVCTADSHRQADRRAEKEAPDRVATPAGWGTI